VSEECDDVEKIGSQMLVKTWIVRGWTAGYRGYLGSRGQQFVLDVDLDLVVPELEDAAVADVQVSIHQ